MKTLNWLDRLKAPQWVNALVLYFAGVFSLVVVAYGFKLLLSLL